VKSAILDSLEIAT